MKLIISSLDIVTSCRRGRPSALWGLVFFSCQHIPSATICHTRHTQHIFSPPLQQKAAYIQNIDQCQLYTKKQQMTNFIWY